MLHIHVRELRTLALKRQRVTVSMRATVWARPAPSSALLPWPPSVSCSVEVCIPADTKHSVGSGERLWVGGE